VAGDELLDGGAGRDYLDGGDGADSFLFSSTLGTDNVGTIADFFAADDSRSALMRRCG